MNDAMQVVLKHVFESDLDLPPHTPWPFPLACTPWKRSETDYFDRTLTLRPHRHLVKAALVNKSAHAQFKQFIEAQMWLPSEMVFYHAFCTAVHDSGFTTWKGQLEALLHAWTFSVYLHDTLFAATTIASRLTETPDVYEIVAHYGVGASATTSPVFRATVPAVEFMSLRRLSSEQHVEQLTWVRDTGRALREFLQAQHKLRV
jgi:hypothetical protein